MYSPSNKLGYITIGLVVRIDNEKPGEENLDRVRLRIFEVHGDPLYKDVSSRSTGSVYRYTPDSDLPWVKVQLPANTETPDSNSNDGMYSLYPPDSLVYVMYPTGDEPIITSIVLDSSIVGPSRAKLKAGGNSRNLSASSNGSYVRSGSPDNVTEIRTQVSENAYIILQYLTSKGLNTAAAIGILANIRFESNFDPAAFNPYDVNVGPSAGIMQWHADRYENMIARVPNWKTNLLGQLDYLWGELTDPDVGGDNYYFFNTYVYKPLLEMPNTGEGAINACKLWLKEYGRPYDLEGNYLLRVPVAIEYWNYIVVSVPGATLDAAKSAYKYLFSYPLIDHAIVTSDYGPRVLNGKDDFHLGIDLGVAQGTPVYAAGDGVVISIADTFTHGKMDVGGMDSYGNHVLIDHGTHDGIHYLTMYAHLSQVSVYINQKVKGGQYIKKKNYTSSGSSTTESKQEATLIGYSGDTGASWGAHLHFEVDKGQAMNGIDPKEFLNF